ncbi:SH3 domain-containing protein 1 isoform X2 [Coffea eugenioides]|uniref:SH3 domain-containing protein 1 isoform X2 n=1 Tax=Coffea eugenioides TaxID=49369 RepID=UPI000F5D4180|nr:SH3 domain-containing protein 1-like isoform X4 [Coffea arabica]XP_027156886.1 SH3 domain-containing protein 1 isoform X2 [Coffea eugenioides]
MDAIKKQASKLREQVARQQQAILRQLGQLGHEAVMVDDTEMECYQQLQNLYKSTRTAKHLQRDIVRGVEGFISISKKQMEITRKLAEDCCKYGIENQSDALHLARAASGFSTTHVSMEDHRETMLGILANQVCEPLRVSIAGAPLEDARHLTHRYDRVRQEFEAQAADVLRRRSKCKDSSAESVIKLKSSEAKLTELKSSMLVLGNEAISAMLSVEDQQQQLTFQKLLSMVDAERSYHQNIVALLEKLHSEMILEEQLNESSLHSSFSQKDSCSLFVHVDTINKSEDDAYFIAKVIHSFDAQADGELSLAVDDYVVVRQVAPNGWSEGECKGEAGWFPSAYVERRDKIPASKHWKVRAIGFSFAAFKFIHEIPLHCIVHCCSFVC